MVRTTLFSIAVFLFSNSLLANQLRVFSNSQTKILLYAEEGGWIVEKISIQEGRLPEKTDRRFYIKKQDAIDFLGENTESFRELRNSEYFSSPHFVTEDESQVIWAAENTWSWEWEKKYAEWIRANLDPKFFVRNGIKTDCADVAYAVRWIFSRIHKLPAANRLGSGSDLFTNESMKAEWAKLPTHDDWTKDQRFRKALDYLLNLTYTHTLSKDTYAIGVAPESFLEGTIGLFLREESGHTTLVNEINSSQGTRLPVYIVASTTPRDIRELNQSSLQDYGFRLDRKFGGILKPLWAEKNSKGWSLRAGKDMPYFSEAIYKPGFFKPGEMFVTAIFRRINPSFDPPLVVKESFMTLIQTLETRKQVVKDGFEFCRTRDCSPGTSNFEAWSTPSRDKHVFEGVANAAEYTNQIGGLYPLARTYLREGLDSIVYETGQHKFSLELFYEMLKFGLPSSDPRDSIAQRWALEPEALRDRQKIRFAELTDERTEKIVANKCVTRACGTTSPNYLAHHTFELDKKIREQATAFRMYCYFAPGTACVETKELAKKTLITLGTETTLDQLELKSAWLNSDPRWSPDVRWGGLSQKLKHVWILDGLSTLITSDNGLLFVESSSKDLIFNASDLQQVGLPVEFKGSAFNWRNGSLAVYEKDSQALKVFDFSSKRLLSVPLKVDTNFRRPVWISANQFLFDYGFPTTNSILFEVSAGGVAKVTEFENSNYLDILMESKSSPAFLAHSYSADRFKVTDLSDPNRLTKIFDLADTEKAVNPQPKVFGRSGESLLIHYRIKGDNSRYLAVNWRTGETTRLPLEKTELSPLTSDVFSNYGSALLIFTAGYKVHTLTDIGVTCAKCSLGIPYFLSYNQDMTLRYNRLNPDHTLTSFQTYSDNEDLASGNLLSVFNNATQTYSLRNIDTGETLITEHGIFSLTSELKASDWWKVRYGFENAYGIVSPYYHGSKPILTSNGIPTPSLARETYDLEKWPVIVYQAEAGTLLVKGL
jgi:hypothetical protein